MFLSMPLLISVFILKLGGDWCIENDLFGTNTISDVHTRPMWEENYVGSVGVLDYKL